MTRVTITVAGPGDVQTPAGVVPVGASLTFEFDGSATLSEAKAAKPAAPTAAAAPAPKPPVG